MRNTFQKTQLFNERKRKKISPKRLFSEEERLEAIKFE